MPPAPNRFTRLENLERRSGQLREGLLFIQPQLAAAFAKGSGEMMTKIEAVAGVLQGNVTSLRRRMQTVNQQLAEQARIDIVAAYDAKHAEMAHTSAYRITANKDRNRRYAGGMLRAALADHSMTQGTYNGIALINRSLLDERAKQWKRLNYGTLPGAGNRSRNFRATMDGLVLATFGLNEGPRPAFMVPRGFWYSGAGGPEFYPASERPKGRRAYVFQRTAKPAKGIEAWHFLDAGVESVARHMGPAYEKLFDAWAEEAQERRRGPFHKKTYVIRPGSYHVTSV